MCNKFTYACVFAKLCVHFKRWNGLKLFKIYAYLHAYMRYEVGNSFGQSMRYAYDVRRPLWFSGIALSFIWYMYTIFSNPYTFWNETMTMISHLCYYAVRVYTCVSECKRTRTHEYSLRCYVRKYLSIVLTYKRMHWLCLCTNCLDYVCVCANVIAHNMIMCLCCYFFLCHGHQLNLI